MDKTTLKSLLVVLVAMVVYDLIVKKLVSQINL
jgi:hypothetical protein